MVFDTMPLLDYLGSPQPQMVLYLPHRPNGLDELRPGPGAQALMAANSNHWRKIVTLLAKLASPDACEWRTFRDERLFRHTALCFAPAPVDSLAWHWIGGTNNLQRFQALNHNARPLADAPGVSVDAEKRLLLTPYPDYRQFSNRLVSQIRHLLHAEGFYDR